MNDFIIKIMQVDERLGNCMSGETENDRIPSVPGEFFDARTKEDQVADFLREEIISGRIPRGTRLKQAEIAGRLRTSITPVREALKLLEAEGYVTGNSYRSPTVAPFDVAASAEILNLRILLETSLVRSAVEKFSAHHLSDLRLLAAEFENAVLRKDSFSAQGLNYRFHRRLYGIAELPQTLHFVQILWARYAFDLIHKIEGRAERAVAEHSELLEKMSSGDAAGAVLATQRHIESGWEELRKVLSPERTPTAQ